MTRQTIAAALLASCLSTGAVAAGGVEYLFRPVVPNQGGSVAPANPGATPKPEEPAPAPALAIQVSVDTSQRAARVGTAAVGPVPSVIGLKGPVTWSFTTVSGTAPANAAVSSDGAMGFTPDLASVGTWSYVLTATDTATNAKATTPPVTVTISGLAVAMPTLQVHRSYGTASQMASVTGASGTVSYTLDQALPGWLVFSNGRLNAVTPPVAGQFGPYLLTASDASNASGSVPFGVEVLPPPSITGVPLSKSPPQYSFPDLYVLYIRIGTPITGALPTFTPAIGQVTWRFGGNTGQSGGTTITDCSTVPSTAMGRGLSVDSATGQLRGTPNGATPDASCYLIEGVDAADNAVAAYRVLTLRQ